MARKYVQLGNTNAQNFDAINDNFKELYDSRSTIYDDVQQLQSDVEVLQGNVLRTPLSNGTNLNDLGAGHYYIPDYDTATTITNKPDSTNQTATIDVVEAGNTGQLIMIYRGCIKEYINEWVRVYYADSWGDWLREGGNDTGWVNLTLNSGWSCSYNTDVAMYRKIGNVVHLRGLVNATQAAGKVIGTLPEGFRPSGHFERFTCPHQQSGNVNVEVGYTGQIKDYTKPDNTEREFISLYGISYIV